MKRTMHARVQSPPLDLAQVMQERNSSTSLFSGKRAGARQQVVVSQLLNPFGGKFCIMWRAYHESFL